MSDAPGYFTNARNDIHPFLPEKVVCALDVGCATGELGRYLKDSRGAEVWGIEINPEAAASAAQVLDRVLVGDALEQLAHVPDSHFDLVTATDVLEHLPWPDEVLRAIARKLKPGGVVVASLPNIRQFNALWELVVDGEFRYRADGIYDITHLRFFTRKSIPFWFERAGFRVTRLEGINGGPGRKFKIFNALALGRLSDCNWVQFAIVAEPIGP